MVLVYMQTKQVSHPNFLQFTHVYECDAAFEHCCIYTINDPVLQIWRSASL